MQGVHRPYGYFMKWSLNHWHIKYNKTDFIHHLSLKWVSANMFTQLKYIHSLIYDLNCVQVQNLNSLLSFPLFSDDPSTLPTLTFTHVKFRSWTFEWFLRWLTLQWFSAPSFRFDEKENVSNCIQLKTSVIKGIKNQLLEQFPEIESWLNHIMPKKDPVKIVRWYNFTFLICKIYLFIVLWMFSDKYSFISIVVAAATSTLKSWQWMESYSSSDREMDHSTQLSDCCTDVRFLMLIDWIQCGNLGVHTLIWKSLLPWFVCCRSFHPSTPASRQRGH